MKLSDVFKKIQEFYVNNVSVTGGLLADSIMQMSNGAFVAKSYEPILRKKNIKRFFLLLEEKGYIHNGLANSESYNYFHKSDENGELECFISVFEGSVALSISVAIQREKHVDFEQMLTDNKIADEGIFYRKYIKSSDKISNISIPVFYSKKNYQHFYPWLKCSLGEFAYEFKKSTCQVLILYGKPGNGKSNFIERLALALKTSCASTADYEIMAKAAILTTFFNNDYLSFLIFEEADKLIQKKKDGNPYISNYLDFFNGLDVTEKKLIIVTNAENLDEIEPALLRRGRCFAAINFRDLTTEEAKVILQKEKIQKDLSEKDTWTLAELLNPDKSHLYEANTTRKKSIGFIN